MPSQAGVTDHNNTLWLQPSQQPLIHQTMHSDRSLRKCILNSIPLICCLFLLTGCLVYFVCFALLYLWGFFKDQFLFPRLTCFTVSKEHPLFTYSRAPGLFSSSNLSQVIVRKSQDAWQENKGHTST